MTKSNKIVDTKSLNQNTLSTALYTIERVPIFRAFAKGGRVDPDSATRKTRVPHVPILGHGVPRHQPKPSSMAKGRAILPEQVAGKNSAPHKPKPQQSESNQPSASPAQS
jgi:hypothetical protein